MKGPLDGWPNMDDLKWVQSYLGYVFACLDSYHAEEKPSLELGLQFVRHARPHPSAARGA